LVLMPELQKSGFKRVGRDLMGEVLVEEV
jgi:hypothetical protein